MNRAYEFRKGRNGKGTPATFRLDPRRIGVIVDGGEVGRRYIEVCDSETADSAELMVAVLRVTPGAVQFCRPLGRQAIPTAELAALFEAKGPKPPRGAACAGRRVAVR